MKIGIISDTHDYLDPATAKYFAGCDEIWHAGDIGSPRILEELNKIKPTVAVFGNIDNQEIFHLAPENQLFEREGVKILITHIAGKPPKYNTRVKKLIQENQPKMLVCGHSHILKVEYDKTNEVLYVNPGAAGQHGFHHMKTLLRLDLIDGSIKNLEVIELGLRGKMS